MSNLLGGHSNQSQASNTQNVNNPLIQSDFGSTAAQTGGISQLLAGMLGLPGSSSAAGQAGYNNYQNTTGFQNQLDTGSRAITDNAASRGLLQSGATGQALTAYGTNLGQQNYNSYLSQLFNLGSLGTQAGQLITSAGQQSNSTGKSSSKTGLGL